MNDTTTLKTIWILAILIIISNGIKYKTIAFSIILIVILTFFYVRLSNKLIEKEIDFVVGEKAKGQWQKQN